jgi:L-asparaginase
LPLAKGDLIGHAFAMVGRVYIANTGGTIGMKRKGHGYSPEPGFLQELLSEMPELKRPELPKYDLHELDPLLDSANMNPSHWAAIAEDIVKNYDSYDGFLILHGTDTMAYTAAALSFMLENLGKPVILTGSQIPLCEIRNDARENLIDALMIAARFPIPEVCIAFQGKLLRGNRSVKVTADGLDAFASPNYPPLARGGLDIQVAWSRVRTPPDSPLRLRAFSEARVAALRLFPGIQPDLLSHILKPPLQGLVLECYGVGNAPEDPAFLAPIREATDRGVVVVVCSQCLQGRVRLDGYATGAGLAASGAIGAHDMNVETALPKLFYLFAQGLSPDAVKHAMQQDLRGELTPFDPSPSRRPSSPSFPSDLL